jgi:hypothetical protein
MKVENTFSCSNLKCLLKKKSRHLRKKIIHPDPSPDRLLRHRLQDRGRRGRRRELHQLERFRQLKKNTIIPITTFSAVVNRRAIGNRETINLYIYFTLILANREIRH